MRSKLESVLKDHERHIPVASVMISAHARHAVAVLAPPGYRAGPSTYFGVSASRP